jgi:tetraprenyl-beta-curcumene synthase
MASGVDGARRSRPIVGDLRFASVFVQTAWRYPLQILPHVRRELASWESQAAEIPDRALRRAAQEGLAKRGNVEGAALFAILAPRARRRATVQALVAFQTAYNYLDTLSERASDAPAANAERLHRALLVALQPDARHEDYYAFSPHHEDGGYLTAIVDACRHALGNLPSFPVVALGACRASARIVAFQAGNLTEAQGGQQALERWASAATPAGSGLAWRETAAAAGSSLAVHALIAAAANPLLERRDAVMVEGAYFPWIGALHSLLDSLVDRIEDDAQGQTSLLHDVLPADVPARFAYLAQRASTPAVSLPRRDAHRMIVTAMCSYYLSAPECRSPDGRETELALTDTLGQSLRLTLPIVRLRRLLQRAADRTYA